MPLVGFSRQNHHFANPSRQIPSMHFSKNKPKRHASLAMTSRLKNPAFFAMLFFLSIAVPLHAGSQTAAGDNIPAKIAPIVFVASQPGATTSAPPVPPASSSPSTQTAGSSQVADELWLRAQIALTRRRFSCGPIDGVKGSQTTAALYAFQQSNHLPKTGELDHETRARLFTSDSELTQITLKAEDFEGLQALSSTWLGKSQQTALAYENIQELIAERTHALPALLEKLNPEVTWSQLLPGATLQVPSVQIPRDPMKAAQLHIRLGERVLQVRDADGLLLAHFPVSIARDAEKRPEGALHVKVVIADPDYTFDPAVFSESEEARSIGRKLILPPGPNNPVGVAWIGLDLPGYGIHGTPNPEKVGRTESHGCFRLANWDARTLLAMAWTGLPVLVDP